MSYQEKRTIVNTLTGILVLAAYCIYAFGPQNPGALAANDLKFWARTMLIFIGIGAAATIVIQIIFHILMSVGVAVSKTIQNEQVDNKDIEKTIKAEMVEDEMGKLIELKAMRVGFVIAGAGFIASLVALLLGASPAMMLNIMFVSFSAGSILEGITQVYYYRRGITHA